MLAEVRDLLDEIVEEKKINFRLERIFFFFNFFGRFTGTLETVFFPLPSLQSVA